MNRNRPLLIYSIFRPLLAALFVLAASATRITAAELAVPDDVIFKPGLEYSNPDHQHLQLNLARPKNDTGPFPAIVCIHGGGFRAGHRDSYNNLCLTLAQQGFVAVTVSYQPGGKSHAGFF